LIALLSIVACKEKPTETDALATKGNSVSNPQGLENPFLGAWIHPYYSAALAKSKSAYALKAFNSPVSELVVSQEAIVLVHNNSEGETLGYKLQKDEGETIGVLDNKAKLIALRKDRLRLMQGKAEVPFIKSPEPSAGVSVFETLVRSELIVGTYSGAGEETSFMINGDVTGLLNFVNYRVITRFDDLGDFDMMEFTSLSGEKKYMGWEVKKDELILYEVIEGGDYVYAKGKEQFRLTLKQAMS